MEKEEFFHREVLASRLAKHLLSVDGSSGLFITAPRRTGKSTFIREDLIPVLKITHSVEVVYADLWEDPSANPGDVIVTAIKDRLLSFSGLVMKAAKASGLEKIKVGGLELNLDGVGFGKGETLTKALFALAYASKKPIVMVIDEAQHTQTSEEGRHALFALKAARDALNAGDGPGFRLLAIGSNTDKLAMLVEDKDQAFYQAPMTPLPLLGKSYIQWRLDLLDIDPKPSIEAMEEVFLMCSNRPEPLKKVLKDISLSFEEGSIDDLLKQSMVKNLSRSREIFLQQVNDLNPLDAAVLKVMAREGTGFSPYAKSSNELYRSILEKSTADQTTQIDNSSIQQALERLRGVKMVWRSGRGAYAIEDTQHINWLNEYYPESDKEKSPVERPR